MSNFNPQEIFDTHQAAAAVNSGQRLVKLENGATVLEKEFPLLDQLLKAQPQQNLQITPIAQNSQRIQHSQHQVPQNQNPRQYGNQTNSSSFHLNQNGVIAIVGLTCVTFLASMTLLKTWGTTDEGKLQAERERMSREYEKLGKHYEFLGKATAKLGEKTDVCVSWNCSKNYKDKKDQPSAQPQPAHTYSGVYYGDRQVSRNNSQDFNNALKEVTNWKKQGNSKSMASEFVRWIERNDKGNSYPSPENLRKAINQLY